MIPIQWTANVANDPEAKASFEESFALSTTVIDRLLEIIDERERTLKDITTSPSSYRDNASWAYEQAHNNGRLEEIKVLKQLLTTG